ncbi:unnamed protein product [Sphagnum compactum]
MNETICSPSPLPIYDQMVSTSTRRHAPKLQFVVNWSCEGRKVAVPLSCSYGSLWIDQMKGVKGKEPCGVLQRWHVLFAQKLGTENGSVTKKSS